MLASNEKEITCLNCDGKGYIARLGGNGMKYPYRCEGCKGTGKQVVRVL